MVVDFCTPRKHPAYFTIIPMGELVWGYARSSGMHLSHTLQRHCIPGKYLETNTFCVSGSKLFPARVSQRQHAAAMAAAKFNSVLSF